MVKKTEDQEGDPSRRSSWFKTFWGVRFLQNEVSYCYQCSFPQWFSCLRPRFYQRRHRWSIQKKFKCSTSQPVSPDAYDVPSDDVLGVPDVTLTDEQSQAIVDEFSLNELNKILDTLDEGKAEGPDQITNSMLKNCGPIARDHILDLFNSVLLGRVCPED